MPKCPKCGSEMLDTLRYDTGTSTYHEDDKMIPQIKNTEDWSVKNMKKCMNCGQEFSDAQMSEQILRMIKGVEFNSFYGEIVYELLDKYRSYWSKLEVPIDIDIFHDATDTLFIYPANNKTTDVTFLLGKALGGDECSWRESNKYVRVWWD